MFRVRINPWDIRNNQELTYFEYPSYLFNTKDDAVCCFLDIIKRYEKLNDCYVEYTGYEAYLNKFDNDPDMMLKVWIEDVNESSFDINDIYLNTLLTKGLSNTVPDKLQVEDKVKKIMKEEDESNGSNGK